MSTIAATPGFGTTRTALARPSVRRPAGPVRLTRRGRLVLLIGFVAVVFALLSVFGGQSAATSEVGEPVPTRTVQVSQGDTLWNIAATVAEPGQVRAMIHQIQELNALSGAGLEVGQQIAVPLS
jgi:LysM repeat protein